MSTESQVHSAKSPQEALMALAKGVDVIIALLEAPPKADPWLSSFTGPWDPPDPEPAPQFDRTALEYIKAARNQSGTRVHVDADLNAEVVLPAVSDERKEARRQFERQQLRLADHLTEGEDWTEAYALGGPAWLYHGNRDLVMSYPRATRALMVEDIEIDSPAEAQEIARDILKFEGETGPGSPAMSTDVFR